MPRGQSYSCTSCGGVYNRDNLVVKKVVYVEMGAGGKLVKSRVVDWLCPLCTTSDPDWQRPSIAGIPRTRRLNG